MDVRILTAADLDLILTPRRAVDAMRRAFGQLSAGRASVPIRGALESERGTTLLMPAFLRDSRELGAKIVSVFPENAGRGEPVVQGMVLLLDATSGAPRALLDGTRLTAIRTAAGSALATELLADPGADVLAVFGAGPQGRAHIELLAATRRLREIRIVSRSGASAGRLAAELRDAGERLAADGELPRILAFDDPRVAVRDAGVVVTATTSREPVFDGGDLPVGSHVNAVGSYRPDMQEVDETTVLRARVVVDQRAAVWEECGDLIVPLRAGVVTRAVVDAELGDIVNGAAPAGRGGREITLFESVGNAAQDVAMAGAALRGAEREDVGRVVAF